MSIQDSDIAAALELFEELGDLSTRKMFGGLSIYHQGVIFVLMSRDGTIHLKAKDDMAQSLAAAGSTQFNPGDKYPKGKGMPYWTLPDAALDDPEAACDWARKALAALT